MKTKKCPYWEECPLYDKENKICNEEEGFYGSSYPGCFRRMSESENKK